MTTVRSEKLTVDRDEGLVVFLIGARVNAWWNIPILWAVNAAAGRMMRELLADPDSGLLSYEAYGGRTTLMVQYWRSLDDLMRYAHAREREHLPAWKRWLRRWGLGGAVGIWHETYLVEPGAYECFYQHMPAFGLGKVGPLVAAEGDRRTARQRLGRVVRRHDRAA